MEKNTKVLTVRVPVPVFRRFKKYLADQDRSAQDQLLNWIEQCSNPRAGKVENDPFRGGLSNSRVMELMDEDRQRELIDDARWLGRK